MTDAAQLSETVEQVVHIDATPETVWSFWTEPARLCEWWGVEADAVAETGGIFRVVMDGGPVMLGEFLELEPPRRLWVSFGWEGGAPGGPLWERAENAGISTVKLPHLRGEISPLNDLLVFLDLVRLIRARLCDGDCVRVEQRLHFIFEPIRNRPAVVLE